jgi:hypothetical protein
LSRRRSHGQLFDFETWQQPEACAASRCCGEFGDSVQLERRRAQEFAARLRGAETAHYNLRPSGAMR